MVKHRSDKRAFGTYMASAPSRLAVAATIIATSALLTIPLQAHAVIVPDIPDERQPTAQQQPAAPEHPAPQEDAQRRESETPAQSTPSASPDLPSTSPIAAVQTASEDADAAKAPDAAAEAATTTKSSDPNQAPVAADASPEHNPTPLDIAPRQNPATEPGAFEDQTTEPIVQDAPLGNAPEAGSVQPNPPTAINIAPDANLPIAETTPFGQAVDEAVRSALSHTTAESGDATADANAIDNSYTWLYDSSAYDNGAVVESDSWAPRSTHRPKPLAEETVLTFDDGFLGWLWRTFSSLFV